MTWKTLKCKRGSTSILRLGQMKCASRDIQIWCITRALAGLTRITYATKVQLIHLSLVLIIFGLLSIQHLSWVQMMLKIWSTIAEQELGNLLLKRSCFLVSMFSIKVLTTLVDLQLELLWLNNRWQVRLVFKIIIQKLAHLMLLFPKFPHHMEFRKLNFRLGPVSVGKMILFGTLQRSKPTELISWLLMLPTIKVLRATTMFICITFKVTASWLASVVQRLRFQFRNQKVSWLLPTTIPRPVHSMWLFLRFLAHKAFVKSCFRLGQMRMVRMTSSGTRHKDSQTVHINLPSVLANTKTLSATTVSTCTMSKTTAS